ncbi:hypothetical protein Tco_0260441 [Tanacetum coccineum]
MEPDFSNMTLNEYWMYQGKNKDLERKSVASVRNRILEYPDSNEEDEEYSSLPPLLLCFQTPQPCATLKPVHHNNHSEVDIERAENIRKMEHEVLNRCDNITDYEDSNQEDGGLLTFLPSLLLMNLLVEDIEMDEDYDIDNSNTKEAIQWNPTQDPFLVILEPDVQSSFLLRTIPSSISNERLHSSTWATKWFKRLVAYDKCNRDSYERRHFKFGLVRYHAEDDDGVFVIMDVARRSRLGAWLRVCCSSSY